MLRFFRPNIGLFLVLIVVAFFRLPSFFEPYWYGDEQIYLAIAQALNRGEILYRDIWDNKPPLLYFLYAIIPTLLWAKVAATLFVLGTSAGVYYLSKSLFKEYKLNNFYSLISSILSGILLSIPFLEGTIANAELFFTLPIVWGAYFISKLSGGRKDQRKLFLIGILMFVSFLFKVPAVFDFVGLFAFVFFLQIEMFWHPSKWKAFLEITVRTYFPIFAAFIIPLVFVFAYFYLNNGLYDFITASFSQNASYISVDSGALSKLNNPLFIKAILLLLATLILLILFLKKLISKKLLFLSLWFGFSLYGALLSNRPYKHYLLQIVPPAVILTTYFLSSFWQSRKMPRSFRFVNFLMLVVFVLVLNTLNQMFKGAFALPTKLYYQNFYDYASERKLWEGYATFFDFRTLNSYKIANYIGKNSSPDDSIFVWGDSAGLYVLSDRPAATKFIQAHHLTTVDQKNYELIIEKLKIVQPKFIIVDRPVHFSFPLLEELVAKQYQNVLVVEDLYIYKRLI